MAIIENTDGTYSEETVTTTTKTKAELRADIDFINLYIDNINERISSARAEKDIQVARRTELKAAINEL